jgi:hypothetical protein
MSAAAANAYFIFADLVVVEKGRKRRKLQRAKD